MRVAGTVRALPLDSVNTDQIHLAMYSHLPIAEQAQHCLETVAPGLAATITSNDILVAGRNFGCGSARPAQLDLIELGLRGVIAESVDRKFFGNAVSSGFPVVTCAGALTLLQEGDTVRVDTRAGEIQNLTRGESLHFPPFPGFLSEMLESGGEFAYLMSLARAGLNPVR